MAMMERQLSIPDLILIVGTRVAFGIGIGLLLSEKLNRDQRKAAGVALAAVGAATTVPLAIKIAGQKSTTAAGSLRGAA
jgi:hypothetical protein